MSASYISRANQPERFFINSYDDPSLSTDVPNTTYSIVSIPLKTPILNPRRLQLLRATIPNVIAGLSIPDYQLVFAYTRRDNITLEVTTHAIRILPSYYVSTPIDLSGVPINRPILNYVDLVNLMNEAAAAADSATYNPTHIAGDVVFSYDATRQRIILTGQDAGYTYGVLGWNDERWDTLRATVQLETGITQPTLAQLPMNLRLGYNDSETITDAGEGYILADGYGDLVYSQNVYIRCNLVQGSTLTSNGFHDVLAVIPINAPPLGVAAYTAATVVWNTKIVREIYNITLTFLDDNYMPYPLPNNAVAAIEIGLAYE